LVGVKAILVGTDFSSLADAAVERAASLARRFRAETLDVVHVVENPTRPEGQGGIVSAEAIAKERLASMVIDSGNTKLRRHVDSGDAARRIASAAAELRADLIVMGSHGRPTLARALRGSVTSEVIRATRSEVLVLGRDHGRADPSRIVAAIDLSSTSAALLARAVEVSEAFQSSLHVVSVFEERGYSASERDRARYHAEVARFLDGIKRPSLTHRLSVPSGPSRAKELLAFAENAHVDLIFSGSSARGRLERLLRESTAATVLAEARCPVWVVPSGET
jgi:nucleotide-binding universal stress UspA family protein